MRLALAGFLLMGILAPGAADAAENHGQLRHVVCLKFKADAKPEDIKKAEAAFRDLKNKLPLVLSLEWGTSVGKDDRAKGFTHLFFLTFADEQDLAAYAKSPEHLGFVASFLKPILDESFVFDYHARE